MLDREEFSRTTAFVVDAYSVVSAVLLLSAGALSDRRGTKRVFQAGIGIFAVCSLGCGLAPSAAVLVGTRCLQGLGVGGLALGARSLPSPARRASEVDGLGQVAGVVTLAALTAALIGGGHSAWSSPLVLGGLVVSGVAGAVFIAIAHEAGEPMLPLGLFGSAAFSSATAVGLLINLGFYGELFVLSLHFQEAHHRGALAAGVARLPQMAMAVVGSTASGRSMAMHGPRRPMLIGDRGGHLRPRCRPHRTWCALSATELVERIRKGLRLAGTCSPCEN